MYCFFDEKSTSKTSAEQGGVDWHNVFVHNFAHTGIHVIGDQRCHGVTRRPAIASADNVLGLSKLEVSTVIHERPRIKRSVNYNENNNRKIIIFT